MKEMDSAISKKKIIYPVNDQLRLYLKQYGREIKLPISYNDLLRFQNTISLYDKNNKDTLWETAFYSSSDTPHIYRALTEIYAILKTEGDMSVMEHLTVDRIDYCTFGNTNPFRIRIINQVNDNFDYFYIKRADASRIYGLELEHILSPNRIIYLVDGNTLVEEHIVGIPGDQFLKNNMDVSGVNEIRLAKEFVKFNERCFVRLLGDMRSYNFVIDITPDFEEVHYRIRAIDFDQQSYEGRKALYLPQFFKQNYPFVQLCVRHMTPETVIQYQKEEWSLIAKRCKQSRYRLKDLLDIMIKDTVSTEEKINSLKTELSKYYRSDHFLKCKSMGDIVKTSLRILLKKNSSNLFKQNRD